MKARLLCIFLLVNCWAWAQQAGFVENKGQWDSRILFKANLPGGDLILEKNKIRYIYYDEKTWGKVVNHPHHHNVTLSDPYSNLPADRQGRDERPTSLNMHCVDVELPGANPTKIVSEQPLTGYLNFFLGKDESQWAGHVQRFAEVTYKNLWPGIDMQWLWQGSRYKYNFIVQPKADIGKIKMLFKGMESLSLNEGRLYIKTSVNEYAEDLPVAWQSHGQEIEKVTANFDLKENLLQFHIEQYNPKRSLTIDPVLVFSTYSGSSVDNFGFTAAYDRRGCLFAGGIASVPTTYVNGTYPTTAGAYQQKIAGGEPAGSAWEPIPCDVSISKYSPNGDSLIWATYLGGEWNEYPHSIVTDKHDQLIIFGSTTSKNFPVTATALDTGENGGYDIFISKLSFDGSTLLGSTYLGGRFNDGFNTQGSLNYNYADEFRGEVDVDSTDFIYIASMSQSDSLPFSNLAPQPLRKSNKDGIIAKFDPTLSTLVWGTYWGGNAEDAMYSIIAQDSIIYVGGSTASSNIPTSINAYQSTALGGRADGYIAMFSNKDLKFLGATYLGTSGYDQTYFIEKDNIGNIYATGQTEGQWPVKGNVYSNPNSGQYITKLSPQLDKMLLSTVFGSGSLGNPDLNPSAFMVDFCGNVYFSGWGSDVANQGQHVGSTAKLTITSDAAQDSTDGNDFYLIVFSKDLQARIYATYFGATGTASESSDHVDGGTSRFDPKGIVYQSVCSSCPGNPNVHQINSFPTTPNAVFTKNISPRCSNASFKLDLQKLKYVKAAFVPFPDSVCLPKPIQMNNLSLGGKLYYWDFGDGGKDNSFSPLHSFTKEGKYHISLIVNDSSTCNIIDTAWRTVTVFEPPPLVEFEAVTEKCSANGAFRFNMTQQAGKHSFKWYFGDGTSDSINASPVHIFKPGTYQVKLLLDERKLCQSNLIRTIIYAGDSGQIEKLPNTFTPDGDGLNDCFRFAGIDTVCTKYHFWIYNRWGQELFESTNANECWPGEDPDGIRHPTGTYFYVLTLTRQSGEEEKKNGTITLLRGRH